MDFFGVQSVDTVDRCATSYVLAGPACFWCLVYSVSSNVNWIFTHVKVPYREPSRFPTSLGLPASRISNLKDILRLQTCEGSIPSLRNLQGPLYRTGTGDLETGRPSTWSVLLTSCLEDLSNWPVFLVTNEKLIFSLNLIWRTTCWTHTNLPRNWRTTSRYRVLKSFNILLKRSKLLGCTNRIHQPHPLFQMGCLASHSPKKQFLYAH